MQRVIDWLCAQPPSMREAAIYILTLRRIYEKGFAVEPIITGDTLEQYTQAICNAPKLSQDCAHGGLSLWKPMGKVVYPTFCNVTYTGRDAELCITSTKMSPRRMNIHAPAITEALRQDILQEIRPPSRLVRVARREVQISDEHEITYSQVSEVFADEEMRHVIVQIGQKPLAQLAREYGIAIQVGDSYGLDITSTFVATPLYMIQRIFGTVLDSFTQPQDTYHRCVIPAQKHSQNIMLCHAGKIIYKENEPIPKVRIGQFSNILWMLRGEYPFRLLPKDVFKLIVSWSLLADTRHHICQIFGVPYV